MKTRTYSKHEIITWSQRRCCKCQRFLSLKELKYCKRCASMEYKRSKKEWRKTEKGKESDRRVCQRYFQRHKPEIMAHRALRREENNRYQRERYHRMVNGTNIEQVQPTTKHHYAVCTLRGIATSYNYILEMYSMPLTNDRASNEQTCHSKRFPRVRLEALELTNNKITKFPTIKDGEESWKK